MTDTREAVARFEALLSSQGQELLDWLGQHVTTMDAELRLAAELRARYPADLGVDALG